MRAGVEREASETMVKENKSAMERAPLSLWWGGAALAAAAAALLLVIALDARLPHPLAQGQAKPTSFIADIAYQHLVNLTEMGPRVAGSYENEVLAVGVLVRAVQHMSRHAAAHHRVELDVHRASGAFHLSFFDGMNNIYRDVQSVVVRVSAAGAPHSRRALLLNCHFDTVPDSPGASDDGAGCAVLLEVLRALVAVQTPLRHDLVFLFNGAEENIMQASHAFITQHKWAKHVRAFINIDACGAGGREVLFQAGPRDPWILEVYARVVPHPYASSLAQELFESGLIPADTDYRIFRDFGQLSGVDLAWSSNGYVYHTRLDTAAQVPPAALQRTGDNVLALTHGLLESERLESAVEAWSRQPVFFDVLGLSVVCARAPAATAIALATVILLLVLLHRDATEAANTMYIPRAAWWGACVRAAGAWILAMGAGVCASAAVGAAMHLAGARLAFFTRVYLLVPLYALPGVCVCWWAALTAWERWSAGEGAVRAAAGRGWGAAAARRGAHALCWGGAVLACCALRLRSGFLPLLWALLPALAGLVPAPGGAAARRRRGAWRAAAWCGGAAVPALQTWYLALGSLNMFVPLMGRSGAPQHLPVPPDVAAGLGVCVCACVLAAGTELGAPYSATRPQRYMVFHTRRTVHEPGLKPASENLYWLPHLDPNTPDAVHPHVPEMRSARHTLPEQCIAWPYCGAPYYLPVLSLISYGHELPASDPPLATLPHELNLDVLNATDALLRIDVHPGPSHVVAVLSPGPDVTVVGCDQLWPLRTAGTWEGRLLYFVALHAARPQPLQLHIQLRRSPAASGSEWAAISLAGHALSGANKLHATHAALFAKFPQWTAVTGWGVDLHLYRV